MFAPHLRGRRRSLDQQKKVELCDLVHHGATVEEAADTIGVSRLESNESNTGQ